MKKSSKSGVKPGVVRAPKAIPVDSKAAPDQSSARIVARVPRESPMSKRKLAGTYRVIHGRLEIPRPVADWQLPDGTVKPNEAKTQDAVVGDEVWLNDDDAARLLDGNIVEPLDSRPSRAGKVWTPPQSRPGMGNGFNGNGFGVNYNTAPS